MKAEGVRKVLSNLKACSERQLVKRCTRDCLHCDLIMPINDVLEGLDTAIKVVDFLEEKRKEHIAKQEDI